jgi:hypothetical protein
METKDLKDFVLKTKVGYTFEGVYYAPNGDIVASDQRILILLKDIDFPLENKGKVIRPNTDEVIGYNYPDYMWLFKEVGCVSYKLDTDRVISELKDLIRVLSKNEIKKAKEGIVNIFYCFRFYHCSYYHNPVLLLMLLETMVKYGSKDITIELNTDTNRHIGFKNEHLSLLMPALFSSDFTSIGNYDIKLSNDELKEYIKTVENTPSSMENYYQNDMVEKSYDKDNDKDNDKFLYNIYLAAIAEHKQKRLEYIKRFENYLV